MKKVLIFGTFDILHAGHISVMKQAKALGDSLIVVLARDKRVTKLKGQAPVHDEDERREILSHIDLVDKVLLGHETDVYKVIEEIKPDVIALGYDQQAFTDKLEDKLRAFQLHTAIVRLEAYKPDTHKSGHIKERLLKDI